MSTGDKINRKQLVTALIVILLLLLLVLYMITRKHESFRAAKNIFKN